MSSRYVAQQRSADFLNRLQAQANKQTNQQIEQARQQQQRRSMQCCSTHVQVVEKVFARFSGVRRLRAEFQYFNHECLW
jgi:hypothetical protein